MRPGLTFALLATLASFGLPVEEVPQNNMCGETVELTQSNGQPWRPDSGQR